jgi:NADPH2:quinone reductase
MRYELTDFEWAAIRSLLPNKPRGIPRVDDRRVLNGIFWVLRSGAPWRDLPETYGPRTTCYNRFVRWRQAGVWDRIMDALADHGRLFRAPSNMNFEEAATLPVALATMHNAVVTNGALQPGQSVLIQGASSGVGLMAMQIAKLKGAKLVIGSSTDAGRRARLKEFGADLAVDSSDPGWVDQVLQATGGEGVDLIVDQVSGKVASQNLAATRIKGRIVNVGRLGGTRAEFNFDLHAARRITYIGVTFRTRSIEEIREIFDEVRKDIWPAVESRKLQLPIDKVFAFDDIGKAFEHMEANKHLGKIVVTM